jgi:hypothetical protein
MMIEIKIVNILIKLANIMANHLFGVMDKSKLPGNKDGVSGR